MKLISEISFFNFINHSSGDKNSNNISTIEEYSESTTETTIINNTDDHHYEEDDENKFKLKELTETIIVNESTDKIKLELSLENNLSKSTTAANDNNNNNSNSNSNNNSNSNSNNSNKNKSRKKRKVHHNTVDKSNNLIDVEYKKGYFINSRGMKLVCQEWIPKNPRGIVIVLHGYGDHGQTTLKEDCIKMAQHNFAAFIYDQQGHGLSEGIPAYIRDFDDLVEDSLLFISDIKFRFPNLKRYVCCTSMGGAVGCLVSLKQPEIFDGGLILLAPLIKLDDNMVPNPMVVSLLTWISQSFPTLAIVPGENVLDRSIKDPVKRAEHATHPLTYKGRARIGTGLAILRATSYLQSNLEQIKVPLLILHGSLDRVSSPTVSEELYNKAQSTDKTLKLYTTFWHSLTSEPESDIVYNDIITWMVDRLNPKQDLVGSSSS